jgi:hypothetical protein
MSNVIQVSFRCHSSVIQLSFKCHSGVIQVSFKCQCSSMPLNTTQYHSMPLNAAQYQLNTTQCHSMPLNTNSIPLKTTLYHSLPLDIIKDWSVQKFVSRDSSLQFLMQTLVLYKFWVQFKIFGFSYQVSISRKALQSMTCLNFK